MASRTFTWDAGDGTSTADWTSSANWTGVGSGYPGDSVGGQRRHSHHSFR